MKLSFGFFTGQGMVVADAGGLIPAMTDYTAPSGVASADSEYSYHGPGLYPAWRPFNRQVNTVHNAWAPDAPELAPETKPSGWLAYQFSAPVVVRRYALTAAAGWNAETFCGPPKDWTFEGWDGAAWVVLDTRTNESGEGSYSFTNETAFVTYRINVTAAQSAVHGLQIGNLQMFST